ncbi:zinc ABC transporter substrate-binding protein ZnuA [Vibrio genomosp. F10]|uniref:zinc ABC transporter substrate-binding protein ZnuA n=1 Tax=Vibrio genomosp. F10 TaxID=723171 RepID=UPI0003670DA1|nr:zinc ABC transporter substrate-binding protein ZnuA [Vibrio genomosp. F10]OEF01224.1 zinc ABC transporter substrate-binding protein [Vibrio genomosp. F10 str. 9ZD137]
MTGTQMRFRLLIASILFFNINSAWAMNLLTSIKPIQMIATEITLNAGDADVLLANNTSPHDYALRPSDIRRIRSADLVVWYGHDLEPFLTGVLSNQDNVITLSEIPHLSLREYQGDHDHGEHDGHDHGDHDPHFWLGYEPTLQVAKALADRLSLLEPNNRKQYQQNYQTFELRLKQEKARIEDKLKPVKKNGYYVFHDAYGYFESDYQLNHLGYFTVSPDRKPGAKSLIAIKKTLQENQAKCVFSEPQFTPAIVESVTRGSSVGLGELDPIGSEITVQADSYFVFIHSLADSFVECLK